MDLYIAYGDTLATSTLNTTQMKINDTAQYDVQNRVFIAAVPKNGSTSTAFKMTFHIEPFVTDRNKLDDDKAALLSLIQLSIIGGGISVVFVVIIVMCFIRRFQRWNQLQKVALSEEDEDEALPGVHKPSLDNDPLSSRRGGGDQSKKGDGLGDYSQVSIKQVTPRPNGDSMFDSTKGKKGK